MFLLKDESASWSCSSRNLLKLVRYLRVSFISSSTWMHSPKKFGAEKLSGEFICSLAAFSLCSRRCFSELLKLSTLLSDSCTYDTFKNLKLVSGN